MHLTLTGILISYLLGSIPSAYLFGRVLKGIDIRKHGSGNVGATNAMRVLGKGPGIAVFIIDTLKGFVAVAVLGNMLLAKGVPVSGDVLGLLLALACVFGHNWTIFLGFKGGKGVATTAGTLIAMAVRTPALWKVLGIAIAVWLLTMIITRTVSVATLLATVTFPVASAFLNLSRVYLWTGIILCVLIILRHTSNIRRLVQGKELTFKK